MSTRVLLTCAAIGVATGVLQIGAGALSPWISATFPVVYGVVLGAHVLPGVIAQQVLRLPWVALLTHGIAALVASAALPVYIGRYLGAALLIGGLQEGVSALSRYRHWGTWRFMTSAIIVGVVLGLAIWIAADVSKFEPWAQVIYLGLFVVGPVAWTFVGLAVGSGLRRAGVSPAT